MLLTAGIKVFVSVLCYQPVSSEIMNMLTCVYVGERYTECGGLLTGLR